MRSSGNHSLRFCSSPPPRLCNRDVPAADHPERFCRIEDAATEHDRRGSLPGVDELRTRVTRIGKRSYAAQTVLTPQNHSSPMWQVVGDCMSS